MTALVCGSIAYDNIMVFHDHFKNHILPDKTHMLNLSFVVPDMNKEFGGCAGNIVYNMKLLEGDALPMATVGADFDAYHKRFQSLGIDDRYIKIIEDKYTAQCFITTDLDDNQINFFQIGAMGDFHENVIANVDDISIGIVAPDGKEGMLSHAEQFANAGIPFFFDPGQNVPLINKEEMLAIQKIIRDKRAAAREDKNSGIITLEEAREEGGYPEDIEGTLFVPTSQLPVGIDANDFTPTNSDNENQT